MSRVRAERRKAFPQGGSQHRRGPRRLVAGLVVVLLVATGCQSGSGRASGSDDPLTAIVPATSEPSGASRDPMTSGGSVAHAWVEVALAAIRRDFPAPTIHARNLYHLSVAMWDTWTAFDAGVDPLLVDPDTADVGPSEDDEQARSVAIAYAAHTILSERYRGSSGGEESLAEFDALLAECADAPDAAALGTEVGREVLRRTIDDGANERGHYDADFLSVNPPLRVSAPGTTLVDPDQWQPLELDQMVTQNGIALDTTEQSYVGYAWGGVEPFGPLDLDALDPGPPPRLDGADGGRAIRAEVLQVLAASAMLDPRDGISVDISPGVSGDNTLGTDDGDGNGTNPVTGEPYLSNVVGQADVERVIAEFWADGPTSETPPGHWNTLAGQVSDQLAAAPLRVAGAGPPVDRLEWDVKLYLALNGALHDAAIAAWGLKARYLSVRPISLVRYLGGLGQSSDPDGPAYDPDGLPLAEGLVEVATAESTGVGGLHEGLADHVGEVVVRTWTAAVATAGDASVRVRWIPASTWVPYQRSTFVTPAFAGYVSGHSTFSRAGAEVLAAFTGDPYFPGGLASWTVPVGGLAFEDGPTVDVTLQWATYADAADQAGRSRIAGGIHIPADDFAGREIGAAVGRLAWVQAQSVFGP